MTDNNVVKMHEPAGLTPAQFIEKAIASGASIEVIEKLIAVQERWEANQAKRAFYNAIAEFKADADRPKILKNVEVAFDATSYKHEDLSDMLAAVDPALAKYGLWARWKVHSAPNAITVTCILGHKDGYSEEAAQLTGPPDTSGKKNAIQAIGSTTAYLQRYTLKPALGLAAARDDDGQGGARTVGAVLSTEQVDAINAALLKAGKKVDVDKFLGLAGALSVSDIQAVKYDSALAYIERKTK